MQNDFEEPVFKKYPEIETIKKKLYIQGAVYAAMSGSGSTIFGLFDKKQSVKYQFPVDYFVTEFCHSESNNLLILPSRLPVILPTVSLFIKE